MIVVDVTVLAYAVIRGEQTASVLALRDRDSDWVSPALWRAEFTNVLWKYVRRGDFDLPTAIDHFELGQAFLGAGEYHVPAADVLSMAVQSGCSAYDCHYVALAHILQCRLATHDRKVLAAFPDIASLPEHV
jgi:predicted nucleic acid-binding protein